MSFSIETELATMGVKDFVGDYAAWNCRSVDSEDNRRFVEALRRRMGPGTTASDPMEAAYLGVHLWAHAVLRRPRVPGACRPELRRAAGCRLCRRAHTAHVEDRANRQDTS